MTPLWQQVVVVALVAGAAAFTFWRLGPSTLRLRMLGWFERVPGLRPWAARRRAGLMAGGCSGCAPGKDIHPKR